MYVISFERFHNTDVTLPRCRRAYRPYVILFDPWTMLIWLVLAHSCRAYVILFNSLHNADVTLFARSHRAYVILFDLWTMFWLYLVLTAALTERMWFFVSMPGQCWPDSTAVLRNVYSILAGPTGGLFSYDALTMSMRICLILSSTSTVRVCDLFLMPLQCLTQNPLFQFFLRLLQNVHQSNPSRNQCGNSISNPECSRNLSNYDFSVFVFVFVQVSQLAGNCYKKLLHQSWLFFELIVKGWLLITNIFLTSAILLIALSLKRI